VLSRGGPFPELALTQLTESCLSFLEHAQLPGGRFYNRLSAETGEWSETGADDADGRALFGLGAASALPHPLGERALVCFERGAGLESPSPRANAWAVLGACAVLATHPENAEAAELVHRALRRIGSVAADPLWPWPEIRLAYDNARLAEARIVGGVTLSDSALRDEGLVLLEWLVSVESTAGHFSFTPTGGRGPGELPPGFDQQPLEAGSMADACAAAFDATGDKLWADQTLLAAEWFLGAHDTGVPLFDPASGGCCDGLMRDGRNENQGAESTLALISAFQQSARVQAGARDSAVSNSSVDTIAAPTFLSAAP
jgi:hypothetical protein